MNIPGAENEFLSPTQHFVTDNETLKPMMMKKKKKTTTNLNSSLNNPTTNSTTINSNNMDYNDMDYNDIDYDNDIDNSYASPFNNTENIGEDGGGGGGGDEEEQILKSSRNRNSQLNSNNKVNSPHRNLNRHQEQQPQQYPYYQNNSFQNHQTPMMEKMNGNEKENLSPSKWNMRTAKKTMITPNTNIKYNTNKNIRMMNTTTNKNITTTTTTPTNNNNNNSYKYNKNMKYNNYGNNSNNNGNDNENEDENILNSYQSPYDTEMNEIETEIEDDTVGLPMSPNSPGSNRESPIFFQSNSISPSAPMIANPNYSRTYQRKHIKNIIAANKLRINKKNKANNNNINNNNNNNNNNKLNNHANRV